MNAFFRMALRSTALVAVVSSNDLSADPELVNPRIQATLATATDDDARLERERKNDDQMWQMARQMLVDFGYAEKVAACDEMWKKTSTPQ